MTYTPRLEKIYSGTLRRIAWAHEITMARALEGILEYVTKYIDRKKVCAACQDNTFCRECLFNTNS